MDTIEQSKSPNAKLAVRGVHIKPLPRLQGLQFAQPQGANARRRAEKLKAKQEALNAELQEFEEFEEDMTAIQNINVESPFLLTSLVPYKKDENEDTLLAQRSEEKAVWYLENYPMMFSVPDYERVLPELINSIGVLYTTESGPRVIDSSVITDDDYSLYSILCNIVDETYEPIYILHLEGATHISPKELREIYRDLFKK